MSSQYGEGRDGEGADDIDIDPEFRAPTDGSFDEMREMEKIAELDQLLAEADARSQEMEQRLLALMSQPLPTLEEHTADALLLMPGSPTAANIRSPSSASAAAAAGAGTDDGFFMTSVPGAGVDVPGSPTSAAVAKPAAAQGQAPPPPPAEDPSIWVLEEVEELDAPLVLSSGEGFRPTQEDQMKLDEIDASVDSKEHFACECARALLPYGSDSFFLRSSSPFPAF